MMDEKFLKEIIEFSKVVGKLKKTKRTGWGLRAGIKDAESVADHTFRTAVLAMLIADMKKLNTEKMMRMALLHDLGEAVIGDWDALQTKLDGKVKEKQKKENEALRKILTLLPKELEKKYTEIWEELIRGETAESKLLKDVDKVELLMQATDYEKEGHDKEKLKVFWGAKKRVKDSDLLKIIKLLEKERS